MLESDNRHTSNSSFVPMATVKSKELRFEELSDNSSENIHPERIAQYAPVTGVLLYLEIPGLEDSIKRK